MGSVSQKDPEATQRQDDVIIVGAGPVGLLVATLLSEHNVAVTVLERGDAADNRPRATHYGSPAVKELVRAGVWHDVLSAGFCPSVVTWRKPNGDKIASMPMSSTEKDYPYPMVVLPVGDLVTVLLEHLSTRTNVRVLYGHTVEGLGQTDESAWVKVRTKDDHHPKTFTAPWIVGADGSSSAIRKLNNLPFEGKTWDRQIVATNVYFPFDERYGWTDSNFIIDRENWYMAAKISKNGLWRVTYGEQSGLSDEVLLSRQPEKFRHMLPGNPDPSKYTLTSISPYQIHQRRAPTFRNKRFLLAGDAAHVCNPFGGLGLTGGIVDAGNLADALLGVLLGVANQAILDKYSEERIKAFDGPIDFISSTNFCRIAYQDAETALQNDEFLQRLDVDDKANSEVANELHESVFAIQHDFTQYYTKT
ncbi:putative monooxygenase [Exophiala viscosa]|uniref:putative monooxygenase n=1 Tax=Exophiala viscosa TaxID=2486360 RepID=UPI00218C9106|nr:putative monooxygenase [Exophiala viscosa]